MKLGPKRTRIESLEELRAQAPDLGHCVVRALDLRGEEGAWQGASVEGTVFLGCRFGDDRVEADLVEAGAVLFPRLEGLPYEPYRRSLYTWQELCAPAGPGAPTGHDVDLAIYEHFQAAGGHLPDLYEALAQRIHDHAVDESLRDYLSYDDKGLPRRRAVGIMGGHAATRDSQEYRRVAHLARGLARHGYLVVTGGGPGVMEAGNLGAYLSDLERNDLDQTIEHLSAAPRYTDAGYRELAIDVLEETPEGRESLAIPTWFYGHEPSNVFATAIAKYFSNSLREDGLLALCMHGVIFAPGSAGTTQEIFMDAVQNHYGSLGWISPMIFLGRDRYVQETGLFPLLQGLARGRRYEDFLCLTDDPEEAVDFVLSHPPTPLPSAEA